MIKWYDELIQAIDTLKARVEQIVAEEVDAKNLSEVLDKDAPVTITTDLATNKVTLGVDIDADTLEIDSNNKLQLKDSLKSLYDSTSHKGRATIFNLSSDMNIGTDDTQVTNIQQKRRNPYYDFVVNQTNNGIVVPEGVSQIKITSVMSYLPKSNNESFNNVIKINGEDVSDRQAFIYVQAPVADIRTSATNVAVANVNAGDVISFATKAPATDISNPAKLQSFCTHFIIEIMQTTEETQ